MVPFLTHLSCNCRIGHLYRTAGSLLRSASVQTRSLVQERPAMGQHSNTEVPVYCSYPLDRAAHLRTEEAQATLRQGDNASLILMNDGAALCMQTAKHVTTPPPDEEMGSVRLASISPARLFVEQCWLEHIVFLGIDQTGSPVYAGHTNSQDIALPDGFETAVWLDVRKNSTSMCAGDAALAGTANGLLQWHQVNVFSEDTGEHAASIDAGWARKSISSTRATYARVDPAVIVIATCGAQILLGRNIKWPEGRYSALAGFVEIGESLEEAACREVFEESNVKISLDWLSYVESQPWPFPRSLMVAYRAEVPGHEATDGDTLELSAAARAAAMDTCISQEELHQYLGTGCPRTRGQEDELADVRWFHWQWVARSQGWLQPAIDTDLFFIPGRASLANRMMREVVKEQLASWDGAKICDCVVDEGSFKYVLMRLSAQDSSQSKLIVRGHKSCAYHNDVLQRTKRELHGKGLSLDVCGGGRITHDPAAKRFTIFGYSVAFGPAVHEISAAIIRQQHPFYDQVTVSYEGY